MRLGEKGTRRSVDTTKAGAGWCRCCCPAERKLREIVDDGSHEKKEGAAAPTASPDAKRKVRIPAATTQKAPTRGKSRQPSTVSARRAFLSRQGACGCKETGTSFCSHHTSTELHDRDTTYYAKRID
uniref:Uncharacterized protein n=1 Tax=Rhipicephalus zambeziensis TaxID=60191 RepID=A0A224YJR3_9ACAR